MINCCLLYFWTRIGWTTLENADKYESLLKTKVLPSIQQNSGKGLIGVDVLKRRNNIDNDTVEFMTILWFENMDAIRNWYSKAGEVFTNKDYQAAHIPHEARRLLKKWDEYSVHYDNIHSSKL